MATCTLYPRTNRTVSDRSRRAFSLVEMLLALALTSVVALLVTVMLAGVGVATAEHNDKRKTILTRQMAGTRLGGVTRSAAKILAVNDQSIVLWRGDANQNGKPDLSELCRIEWDANLQKIQVYQSPDDLPPGFDETYNLDADFDAITVAQSGSTRFPGVPIVRHVVDWHVELNDVPASADLMRISLTLSDDNRRDELVVITSLRGSSP